ncbi:MAG: MmcQ/YjbR family DNA-binding protein [bacterium]|nr:MmcQ/YjbR family DNA-binding protein [bacterium]
MSHPRKYDADNPLLTKLRELCLSFPDAFEKEAWGECTFRMEGGTMFAVTDFNHHGSGHIAVWVKAPPLAQEQMVESDPKRYFRPPYMGPKGWVGIRLDVGRVSWKKVREIIAAGYEMSAPKRAKQSGGSQKQAVAQAAPKSETRVTKRSAGSCKKKKATQKKGR